MPMSVYRRDRLADLQRRIEALSVTVAALQRQPERRRVPSAIFGFHGNDVKHELLPVLAVHSEDEAVPFFYPPNSMSDLPSAFYAYEEEDSDSRESSIDFDFPPMFDDYGDYGIDSYQGDEELTVETSLDNKGALKSPIVLNSKNLFDVYNDDEEDADFKSQAFGERADEETHSLEPNLKRLEEFERAVESLSFGEAFPITSQITTEVSLISIHKTYSSVKEIVVGEFQESNLFASENPNCAQNLFDKMLELSSLSYMAPKYAFDPGIDSGSCENVISSAAVMKLKLPTDTRLDPYTLTWLGKKVAITVSKQCLVSFAIGVKYQDNDIVNMEVCHLLGRLWKFDRGTIHGGRQNSYSFLVDSVRIFLMPSRPTNLNSDKGPPKPSNVVLARPVFIEAIADYAMTCFNEPTSKLSSSPLEVMDISMDEIFRVNTIMESTKVSQRCRTKTSLGKRAAFFPLSAVILRNHETPLVECSRTGIVKPPANVINKVVTFGDLVSYCGNKGDRILGEGKFLMSDTFSGTNRAKHCLTFTIQLGVVSNCANYWMVWDVGQAILSSCTFVEQTDVYDPGITYFQSGKTIFGSHYLAKKKKSYYCWWIGVFPSKLTTLILYHTLRMYVPLLCCGAC